MLLNIMEFCVFLYLSLLHIKDFSQQKSKATYTLKSKESTHVYLKRNLKFKTFTSKKYFFIKYLYYWYIMSSDIVVISCCIPTLVIIT